MRKKVRGLRGIACRSAAPRGSRAARRRSSVISFTRAGLANMAEVEGLTAHTESVRVRTQG